MHDMPSDVRKAYELAQRKQVKRGEPLPDWDTLPLELREAFIYVFYQGRLEGLRETREVPEPKLVKPRRTD